MNLSRQHHNCKSDSVNFSSNSIFRLIIFKYIIYIMLIISWNFEIKCKRKYVIIFNLITKTFPRSAKQVN